MAHNSIDHLYCALGFIIWGDLGHTTIYRDKQGKVVWFEKTWPHKPPSPKQTVQRAKMTAAAAAWQALTAAARKQWNLATRRASLCCTGYDLFVHWQLMQDAAAIRTLERQTNTSLLAP